MPENVLIAIFTDTELRLLSVTTGATPDIVSSSEPHFFTNQDQLISSFKAALSQLSSLADQLALILPYTWIDADGKVTKTKKSLIQQLCQTHNLKPVGFMSSDDAVLDYFSKEQGIPSSPVLIEIGPEKVFISVSDMGQVKKRSSATYQDATRLPQICQKLISDLKDNDSLTPKIFVWGKFNRQDVLNFNNYAWIGKDQSDIFLHFPDIIFFDLPQINNIFLNAINSQIEKIDTPANIPDKADNVPQKEEESAVEQNDLDIVDASEFGFIKDQGPQITTTDFNLDPPNLDTTDPNLNDTQVEESSLPLLFNQTDSENSFPKPNINPPPTPAFKEKKSFKFKLPNLNLSQKNILLPFLMAVITVLPVLLFVFFYRLDIDLFVKPFEIDLKTNVEINPQAKNSDFSKKIIAVKKDEKNIVQTDQIKTTGSKIIGEYAQGKVVIFNKTDETIELKKGQIMSTADGLKFYLLNDTQVDASSLDLEQGLISMGKTIAVASASEIGSQSNIVEGTNLSLENYPSSQLIARVEESFAGGSSSQVASVSPQDQANLQQILEEKMSADIDQNKPDTNNNYLLKSTIQTKQGKIEFNREIGEDADSLSATMETVITFYSLIPSESDQLISFLLDQNSKSAIDTTSSKLVFDFISENDNKGQLTMTGLAISKIDFSTLSKLLSLKNSNKIYSILQSQIKEIYDYNPRSNFPLAKLPLMPALSDNINFVIKIEK